MRLFRSLILLLTLVAPTAFADGSYQVEILLFRQNGEPASTRQLARKTGTRARSGSIRATSAARQ